MTLAPTNPPPNADIREMGYLYGDGHSWNLTYKILHPKLRIGAQVWNWTPEVWVWSTHEAARSYQFFTKTEAQAIKLAEKLGAHYAKKLDQWSYRGV